MKLLFFDIETSPMRGWFWGDNLYEQQILEVDQDMFLLGFGFQWNHLDTVEWVGQPDFGAYKRDRTNDVGVVKALWKLLDEADAVLAHNGKRFDVRKANARFLMLGLPPPSPYQVLDTKNIAKKNFALPSNKLDEIARQILDERKLPHTGKKLWFDCMSGDEEAWKLMADYCKQDTALLKPIYQKFLPWIDNHPNWNIHEDIPESCPNCASAQIQMRGSGFTRSTEYQRYSCRKCGKWFRGATIRSVKLR